MYVCLYFSMHFVCIHHRDSPITQPPPRRAKDLRGGVGRASDALRRAEEVPVRSSE